MNKKTTEQIHRLGSPLRLFIILMLAIFSIEFIVMFILPMLLTGAGRFVENLVDSFLLTLLSAPILWMLIVRPLRYAAMQEIAYTKVLLENVVDAVAILSNEGIVESLNVSAEKLFGYASFEVTGMEIKSLLPEIDIISENNGNSGVGSREMMGRRSDGLLCPIELSVSCACIHGLRKQICIIRDISPRKQAEAEIRKLNSELEQKVADRTRQLLETQEELVSSEKQAMLGLIAGNMGNELRNPLGVMNNAVYFLLAVMPHADETVREYLEIIRSEIDNSQRIISDLTDFCRGRSPRTEPVAVHELIRQSRERCTIPEDISFQADLPESLPPVTVDPLQIGQVLRNLIANAVQAMPEGGALRVAARRFDGDFVEITVTDSGEGIAAGNMEKLFQPLFTTKSRGIGLGLAISRKLVEANGGRIEVASELGRGATFTVGLPINEDGT